MKNVAIISCSMCSPSDDGVTLMSVDMAEKVHLLFMANYIDFSDYDFRDEDQVETYCWCYRDLFKLKTKASQEIVNSQLIEFLDEWRQAKLLMMVEGELKTL